MPSRRENMKDKDFKTVFDSLQTEDIEKYIQFANAELEKRRANRKRELWGNVIAAINKYGKETKESIIFIIDDYEYTIGSIGKEGIIYLE